MVGSFLNVVIYRVPAGRSIVSPGSACPKCGAGIRWFDNVPVLSWILLGRRCRSCREPIPARYAAVEALTGALFLAACWLLVIERDGPRSVDAWRHFAAATGLLAALVALSFIDIDHRILPDALTKPGMVLGPICSAFLSTRLQHLALAHEFGILEGVRPPMAALLLSLAGVLVGWGSLRFVAWVGGRVFGQDAMGLGDTKLMGMIGGFVGPAGVLVAVALGFAIGLVAGAVHAIRKGEHVFPFGPWLAAGGAAVLLAPAEVFGGLLATYDALSHPAGGVVTGALSVALLLWVRARLPRWLFVLLAGMVALIVLLSLRALLAAR